MDDDLIDFNELNQEIGGKPRARSTFWRWERAGHFPQRIQVAPNTVRWRRSEVVAWKANLPRAGAPAGSHAVAPKARAEQPVRAEPSAAAAMPRRARRDQRGTAPTTEPTQAA